MTALPAVRAFICLRCGLPIGVTPAAGLRWDVGGFKVIAASGQCQKCGTVWIVYPRDRRLD